MRILRVFLFIIISLVFAIPGSIVLYLHTQNHIIRANENAADLRLNIRRVREKAMEVHKFEKAKKRLPTNEELNCNWGECPDYTFRVWRIDDKNNNDFLLAYRSMGVPFTPLRQYWLEWDSLTNKSNHDHLTTRLSWYIGYVPKLLLDIAVILFPTLVLVCYKKYKRRKTET